MDVLDGSARVYLALGLVVLGLALVVAGAASGWATSRRRWAGPAGALAYLTCFRRLVVGLALVGSGVGWMEGLPWLLAPCASIGLGELLESSYYIVVLRWGLRRGLLPLPSKS